MPVSGAFYTEEALDSRRAGAYKPPLGGVQLPVEQAAQEISKRLLRKIGTVPEHSSLRFFHISWIFEKNWCRRVGVTNNI